MAGLCAQDHSLSVHPSVPLPNRSLLSGQGGFAGSKELTPLSEPRRLGSWGGARDWGAQSQGRGVENVVCWEFPGSHLGCKALDKLLVFQMTVSLSRKWVVTLYSFPGGATEERRTMEGRRKGRRRADAGKEKHTRT